MTKSIIKLFGLVLVVSPLAACSTTGMSEAPTVAAGPVVSNSPILGALNTGDRARAEQARATALDGKAKVTVDWTSASDAQTHGAVVAGPIMSQNGQQCREYSQTVYLGGVPSVARATACRQANGSWANS